MDQAWSYCSRASPPRTLAPHASFDMLSIVASGRWRPALIASWIERSAVASTWPITTSPSSTSAIPKNSAMPSFTQIGRSLAKNDHATWWKPSCWITWRTCSSGTRSVKNASPAPLGLTKNMPPEPVPSIPKRERSVFR